MQKSNLNSGAQPRMSDAVSHSSSIAHQGSAAGCCTVGVLYAPSHSSSQAQTMACCRQGTQQAHIHIGTAHKHCLRPPQAVMNTALRAARRMLPVANRSAHHMHTNAAGRALTSGKTPRTLPAATRSTRVGGMCALQKQRAEGRGWATAALKHHTSCCRRAANETPAGCNCRASTGE